MSEDKITMDELREMFGEEMPIEVVNLLWNSPGDRTIGELRAEVRKMAERYKAQRFKAGDEITLRATVVDPQAMPGYLSARTKLGSITHIPYGEIETPVPMKLAPDFSDIFDQMFGKT